MKCPHCDTPIDEHEASLCLNAWVAEAVMGGPDANPLWYWWEGANEDSDPVMLPERFPGPKFSTDIAAAWEVVAKLYGRNGGYFMLERFDSELGGDWRSVLGVEDVGGIAPTAPLAICRAALKGLGE